MVLKRKIYDEMLKWKNESNGSSVLMIDGARRVGKSFICKQFGENEYKSSIIIDFGARIKKITDIFENEGDNLDIFFSMLSAYYNVVLHKRGSLIVFDEVQRYPQARQLLKYLVADGRYDYIETGSLLSLKQNVKDILIPSEEDHIEMFPLDFEEFLWAMGAQPAVDYIKSCFEHKRPLGQTLHRKVMNDFRQYVLVGGMPQVILTYLKEKDFAAADKEKRRVLSLYRNDVSRFATGYENKVINIFDTIPGQLAKKEKKFKLSSISKSARFRSYEDAFIWLSEAMVVNTCFNATDPNVGLELCADHTTHKLYMADTGLLVTHTFKDKNYISNNLYNAILLDKMNINEGMIMENAVAQMLRSNGHRLFFYSRVDKNNSRNMIEIDFLIAGEHDSGGRFSGKRKICPVEVKSSVYKTHSSLDKFRKKFSSKLGDSFILYTKDVMIKDGVIHLPLYMAMFL